MNDAEDRIYARFNELNEDDVFDVGCSIEPPTGTRLGRRMCRVRS